MIKFMILHNNLILGVDTLPGSSPQSLTQPKFSAVVVNDKGEVVESFDEVNLRKLLKIIKSYAPKIVATDNVFELAPTIKSLVKLARHIPPDVKLVQVTGAPGYGFQPLETLAVNYGFSTATKLSPIKSAEICARLASLGVGFELLFFENETKITISKGHGSAAGGMSQARFQRGAQVTVLRATKFVEKKLKEAGLDFDLEIKRSPHGLEGSVFIVYAPREKLRGIIRPVKQRDLKISITPVYKREVEYKPLKSQASMSKPEERYVIVGIDPGMVTGIAVITLDGEPLAITSGRGISRGYISRFIASYGRPVIVASDVNPPPDIVTKLSVAHDAVLYAPPKSLSTAEKQQLVHELTSKWKDISVKDTHQRDALAAALKAYQAYKSKLDQCVAHVKEFGANISSMDLVKALVIKGKPIKEAIELAAPKPPQPPPKPLEVKPVEHKPLSEREVKLQEALKSLSEEKRSLENKVSELQVKIRELEDEIERLRREERLEIKKAQEVLSLSQEVEVLKQTIVVQRAEIETLKNKLQNYAQLIKLLASGQAKILKFMKAITRDSLNELRKSFEVKKGDIIYVSSGHPLDERVVEELAKAEVKAILSPSPDEALVRVLERKGIPVLDATQYGLELLDQTPIIRDYTKLEEDIKKQSVEIRKKAREAAMSDMARILDEYRAQRAKEFMAK
ncbi:MAG: hypothetical protein DRJ31_04830 [Candidatus Methanomethylicota archaeon]|uniref:DUF460 domain-containing protein n=1 Tax=Thermoproteota archaeon TaxID=2056631 RepID=A0A497ERX4_9CREN|nr:MAG: hypothetical protein DRJ31_04830 [Candidatus Verstraetearchaeota archaeon]